MIGIEWHIARVHIIIPLQPNNQHNFHTKTIIHHSFVVVLAYHLMIVVVITSLVLVELVGRGGGAVASAGVCAVGWGEGRLHRVVTNRER